MTSANPLHLRLFLEGEEIPVVSAQVSINKNAPSSASIQIVPIDEGIDIKPRSMVHLFRYDQDAEEASTYVDKGTYRLMFFGEFIGFSIVRNPQSRGLILQCIDFTGYWAAAHATAIQYGGTDGNFMVDHSEFTGANNTLFDDLSGGSVSERLVQWLSQTPKTPGLDGIKGLAGGIIRVMEVMGGVTNASGQRVSGFNDFFTVAELRARLLQQICAEEKDSSAANLLQRDDFSRFLLNNIQNIGRQITLSDVILLLLQFIYYDYVPNPSPKFEPTTKVDETGGSRTVSLSSTANGERAVSNLKEAVRVLEGLANAVATNDANAPIEQFDPASTSTQADVTNPAEAEKAAVDKAKRITSFRRTFKGVGDSVNGAITALLHQKASSSNPPVVLDDVLGILDSTLPFIFRWDSKDLSSSDINSALASVNRALDLLTNVEVTVTTTTFSGSVTQRVKSVIFRPDCWFSAPPRCNVIFPEQYASVTYDRNFVAEVTRLQVGTNLDLVGRDSTDLLNDFKYAPQTDLLKPDDIADDPRSYRFLMSHELHTGIVPLTTWVNEKLDSNHGDDKSWLQNTANYKYFSARFASRAVSVMGRFNPRLVCGFPAAVILNPTIVPSADKSKITDVDSLMNLENIPYQLVGMIEGVSHNVDQSGGTTSISMSHVRRHRGLDDELLSIKYQTSAEVERIIWYTITKKDAKNVPALPAQSAGFSSNEGETVFVPTATLTPDTDRAKKSLLISATPQTAPAKKSPRVAQGTKSIPSKTRKKTVDPATGKITDSVVNSTVQVNVEITSPPAKDTPFTMSGNITGVPDAVNVQVPSGKIGLVYGTTSGLYGGVVMGVEVVNGKRTKLDDGYVFEAIRVYERVKLSVTHSPPLEELVRPTWMSDGYTNENISERIYQPFLGCRSIVDEIEVTLPGKGSRATYPGTSGSGIQVDSSKSVAEGLASAKAAETDRYKNSVDRALTWWSYIYGNIKSQSAAALDIEQFIRDFTRRPIATIDQILGSSDLTYSVNGSSASLKTGKEGFHSPAVNRDIVEGSKNSRLLGLLTNPDIQMPRLEEGGPQASVPKKYDVRYEKKQAVLAYKRVLLAKGNGLRG